MIEYLLPGVMSHHEIRLVCLRPDLPPSDIKVMIMDEDPDNNVPLFCNVVEMPQSEGSDE